ncbi:MAG: carboxymuconolactone decarboxylase family protein [Gemmatimonadaceae bacterium]|nr:carboxymuconolactone decarboxylase family protein [Gemmatimonadaceae bacterium]
MSEFKLYTRETAPAESRPLLEQVQASLGFTPNLMATLAESPQALEAYLALNRLVSESSLTPQEQQVAILAASVENRCEYCVAAHTVVAGMQRVPAYVVEALRNQTAIADNRFAALARFTRAVVRARGWISDEELDVFLRAGFTNRQVVDVLLAIAQKTLSNYLNHIAGTPLDGAFSGAKWSAPTNDALVGAAG